ncbi:helix-turn-helix transcriptional regulator [Salisediminibacterium selenitireducens]|uniref:Helix-turn-helix type 11 domain protein n=1 Tax=Bacillus selenitireducens (strain ATCC 700615 / DSM 15326 / MLS10) TaxID=439292 RepID=D6XW99_BACIE|nr:helix-turn-helix transcriptional regulator [Salisediminibacterium selenitireducens]ADH99853.1 Helix-turn-helix type 11 domain protein [[Bacillus] selenitireducens MLS10]
MELNERQEKILTIVKENGPITGEQIAEQLSLTRATLRPDLAILTMSGFLEARPRVGYFYVENAQKRVLNDELKKMTVKEFQSIPVVVKESSSVYDAIVTMFLEDVGTLFVVRENSILTGVLSRKDLLRASMGNQDLSQVPVNVIMTRMPNITMCGQDDALIEVANTLIQKQIDGLPVVKQVSVNGEEVFEVTGRMTKTNITKAFVSLAQENE